MLASQTFLDTSMRLISRLLIPVFVAGCFMVTAVARAADELAKPLPADVRVIIDISGSMKKTDPDNLRKPAVDLIARLMPDDSKAGIWTFGQSVNMLVPHQVVDQSWRNQGAQKSASINSIAMFTNIGAALEKATEDFESPSPDYRRNIILLTDGVVDISQEAVVNLNERKRILTELLPRLKEADYRIHTIALSSDADQELMKKLSIATDGIFEVAETADELMSTFLRIFDQAVPAERVPLDENGFLVDSSIQEFTALIFRRAGAPGTVILAPDGKEYSKTDPTNNINWYRTDKYDLITVQRPVAGMWKVKTEMAPGSRVTVVSNLQLVVPSLKSILRSGQTLELAYSFQENGNTVTNKDFLDLLTGKAVIRTSESAETHELDLTQPAPVDGIFKKQLSGFDGLGEYDVSVVIDGKTFKREYIHHLNVTESPFTLEKLQEEVEGKKTWIYRLGADLETVDVANTKVMALISDSNGNKQEHQLNTIGNSRWEFSFAPLQTANYDIVLEVSGVQIDGSPLSETIKADQFYFDQADLLGASAQSPAEPADAEPDAAPEQDTELKPWAIGALVAGNLLVLLLGYFAYRLIAGKGNKDELAEIENTLAAKPEMKPVVEMSVTPDPQPQLQPQLQPIDVADDSQILSMDSPEMSMSDDLMADNLFPLDNMEDPKDKT
jgi:uncharacterized protein (TIGR03503 family)